MFVREKVSSGSEWVHIGRVPNEVAFTSGSRRIFVTNEGDTTVTVIDIVE